ncbi:MAG: mechanosensitive ion channel [Acidimicrobiia bacterium]|nr:mechanosensitive ion channel [Acidimicrobiia bacterium]MDX2466735.1 mechanosensitive ion channel [Acidimicrobiia bacterium]
MDPELERRLIALAVVLGVMLVTWIIGRVAGKRFPGRLSELIGQLVPVLMTAIAVVGLLVIIDPEQADRLSSSVIGSVPKVMIAVIVVIVARALGRIVGLFAETALRPVSAGLAGRARLILSSVILGVGLIIALQQVGISTDIILILVSAMAFGLALAIALGIGLGSVPLARQVAAGRHVSNRYDPGAKVRVGDAEGPIAEIGLASTRIQVGDGRYVDIPNMDFIAGAIEVDER